MCATHTLTHQPYIVRLRMTLYPVLFSPIYSAIHSLCLLCLITNSPVGPHPFSSSNENAWHTIMFHLRLTRRSAMHEVHPLSSELECSLFSVVYPTLFGHTFMFLTSNVQWFLRQDVTSIKMLSDSAKHSSALPPRVTTTRVGTASTSRSSIPNSIAQHAHISRPPLPPLSHVPLPYSCKPPLQYACHP